jgi:hypothetical protein
MHNGDLLKDGIAIYGIYYFSIGVAFLFLYSIFLGLLTREVGGLPPRWCLAAAVFSLATLPPFFIGGFGYIYDLPQLAFSALLALLIAKDWDGTYVTVFAVACLNKETTALFAFLYLYRHWKDADRSRVMAMTAAQVGLAVATYFGLQRFFAQNGGSAIEHYWVLQFNRLVTPNDWPGTVSVAMMVFLLAVGLYRADRLLRGALVLSVPFAALFLYGGWPGEYRVFLEIWPLLIVIWTVAAYALYRAAVLRLPGKADPDGAPDPPITTRRASSR